MINIEKISVARNLTIREALSALNATAGGVLILTKGDNSLERIVTDGDLRRLLLEGFGLDESLRHLEVSDPIVVNSEYTRLSALEVMNKHSINHLPVLDSNGKVIKLLERKELDEQILLSTPHLGSLERKYVDDAFNTNWIAPLGPNVDAFETSIAQQVGSKYAAAVNSGTAAIHLALRVLGVGHNDVVFCSTLTFVASVNPVLYQGAKPVFIDSEPSSWNMSPLALENAFIDALNLGQMPKAVIVVNLYGQSADMDSLQEICSKYDTPIIEDAAESLGAKYKNRSSGTFGLIGVFSFNGNKIITTSGGGVLISDQKDLVDKAKYLSTQAREPVAHYEHTEVGYNYRMSNILAGVGRGQLEVLEERVKARRRIFEMYESGLKEIVAISPMPEPDWSFSTHWLSVFSINPELTAIDVSTLIETLREEMIEARPAWKPMHLQPLFKGVKYFKHSNNSFSDEVFKNAFCLPSGSNMDELQVKRVISVLKSLFTKKSS